MKTTTNQKIQAQERLMQVQKTYRNMENSSVTKYLFYRTQGSYKLSQHYVELSSHYSNRAYKMDQLISQIWGA
mgnify:CR=1 FL=1|tara:strand:- start:77 stop:295 length:219 start_codon:yes stop_codon:yes gene_type:complete